MKKGVVMVISIILVVLFGFSVNGLVDLTQFNDSTSDKLIDFFNDHDQSVHISLVSHAYVLSTTLDLAGLLSEWETVYSYTNLNAPVSGKEINSSAWLITDESTDRIYLVNPTDNSTIHSSSGVTFVDPTDAEQLSGDSWYVSDYLNNRVVLYNLNNNSIVWNYSVNRPNDVDIIPNSDLILVSSYTGAKVELINVTSNLVVANITSLVGGVYDAEYVSNNLWLVSDDNNKVMAIDPTTDTKLWEYSFSKPLDIDYLGNNISLIVSSSISSPKVFQFNFTDGNYLLNYTSVTEPYDVDYISDTEWLITDKSGTKRVSFEKKYYPKNLNFSVGGSLINTWAGEFNSTATVNNFTNALNSYLLSSCSGSCDIPFTFHSDTSGKLNLTLLNITYNHIPAVSIEEPDDGDAWTNISNFEWNMTDGDNDSLSVKIRFFNCTAWEDKYQTFDVPGIHNYSFNTSDYADGNCYKFNITVNDTYNNASDETNTFTIDNTNPLIWNLRTDDADNITRSDTVLNFRVEATDTFLENVTLNGSIMINETGTTYLNTTDANSLGCPTGSANATCFLNATATDIVNRQNSTDLMIIIDDVAPSIENLTSNAANDTADKDDFVNFTVEVSDANLDTVVLGGTTMSNGGSVYYLYIQPVTLGCSAGTTCVLTANASDKAGNSNNTNYSLTIQSEFTPSSGGGGGGSKTQCADSKDNDGDGLIDYPDDPGCKSYDDDDEFNEASSGSITGCGVEWECSDWGECVDGTQTRTCTDLNGCGVDYFKPNEEQACEMPPAPEETFEVGPGVGQATGLFDRIKGNWYYVAGALAVLGGLGYVGWRRQIFSKKGGNPPAQN
ncbi:hypothetical protein KY306_01990 [Candidatus Woesearchaeota archaeon]|nr:hypothetical protein [Candidatus Woesearchaeota archaeon]